MIWRKISVILDFYLLIYLGVVIYSYYHSHGHIRPDGITMFFLFFSAVAFVVTLLFDDVEKYYERQLEDGKKE